MSNALSSQMEQFLASVVEGGLFPTRDAALEAAVIALREKIEPIPLVPEQHMALVEDGIASAQAGRKQPLTKEYWDNLRQTIRDAASDS